MAVHGQSPSVVHASEANQVGVTGKHIGAAFNLGSILMPCVRAWRWWLV